MPVKSGHTIFKIFSFGLFFTGHENTGYPVFRLAGYPAIPTSGPSLAYFISGEFSCYTYRTVNICSKVCNLKIPDISGCNHLIF